MQKATLLLCGIVFASSVACKVNAQEGDTTIREIGVYSDDPRCVDVQCGVLDRPIIENRQAPTDPTTCANGTYCPKCLTDDTIWKTLLDAVGTGTAPRTVIPTLLVNNWLSAELVDNIANILLHEVMGFTVDTAPIAINGNTEVLCCQDNLLELEKWGGGDFVDDDGYFTLKQGSIGYTGEAALLVPGYTEAAYPLATAYNAYNYLPEYREILPRGMSTNCTELLVDQALGCVEGNYYCDVGPSEVWTDTTCTQGRYIPPQCQADPTNCSEIFMANPAWDAGYFEGLIKNTGLPFVVAYFGASNLGNYLHRQQAMGNHFMFYWFTPDPLTASLDGKPVNFKAHNAVCEAKRTTDPTTTEHDCGFPVITLKKWARRDVLSQDVDLEFFFEKYQLGLQDLEVMMMSHVEGGGTQQVWNLTCDWVRNNYATWKDMVKNTAPDVVNSTTNIAMGDNTAIVAMAGGISLVVLVLLVALGAFLAMRHRTTALVQYAPKDTTVKYCAMFVSLKDETLHWEHRAEEMPTLMQEYHKTIDRVAEKNRCYVVKYVSGAVLVVSVSAEDMLRCAAAAIRALKEVSFNSSASGLASSVRGGNKEGNAAIITSPTESVQGDTPLSDSVMSSGRPSNLSNPSTRNSVVRPIMMKGGGSPRGSVYSLKPSTVGSFRSRMENTTTSCGIAQFSIGINYDFGIIDFDENRRHYDFNGPPVDGAARASDKAQGGQILVTGAVASANDADGGGKASDFDETHFDVFCPCPTGKDVTFLQFNPPGLRVRFFSNKLKGGQQSQQVDSIASALEQQSTGVTQKKVTLLSLFLPSMLTEATELSRGAFAKSYAEKWLNMQAIVAKEKGHIISVVGARVLISFNGAHPCPNAVQRAFLTVETLYEDIDPDLTAGLSQELSIVGRFPLVSGGSHEALVSKVAETATFLQQLTADFPRGYIHCLSHEGLHSDLGAFAVEEFIDFVELPGTAKPRLLTAVHGLQPPAVDDDEWMYELEQQGKTGGFSDANEIFTRIIKWEGPIPSSLEDPLYSATEAVPEEGQQFVGFENLSAFFTLLEKLVAESSSGCVEDNNNTAEDSPDTNPIALSMSMNSVISRYLREKKSRNILCM